MSSVSVQMSREWCLLRIEPGSAATVEKRLADLELFAFSPVYVIGEDDQKAPLLNGLIFAEYDEAKISLASEIEGVIGPILNSAGRVLDIPSSIIDALKPMEERRLEIGPHLHFRARLSALSDDYRVDFLLAEIARLRATMFRTTKLTQG